MIFIRRFKYIRSLWFWFRISSMRCAPLFLIVLITGLGMWCIPAKGRTDLEKLFTSPPRSARPHVMWWWLNSHVSKTGITRDLEEMKKQGVGGALIFDASPVDRWQRHHVNPVPAGPAFLSPEWRDCFRHAIREARRLDIELGVSMTSGFNAGGPWVTPAYGQQELVWSELKVKGGDLFSGTLPLPSGPLFGDNGEPLAYSEMEVNNDLVRDEEGHPIHYRDVALLAVKLDAGNGIHPGRSTPPRVKQRRVKHWPLKSVHSFAYPENGGFLFEKNYEETEDRSDDVRLFSGSVVNITRHLDDSGRLTWDAPEGEWLIFRFGHTHTGVMLQATNPGNRGLAMNHLSREAASRHFEEIAEKLADDNERAGGGLKYLYLDSWEVRIANWTPGFEEEFLAHRGYDMTPYMPALAGYIVDSREITNRFLHDYRKTIGDCIADNYYGAFRTLCHARGLEFRAEMATTPIPADMLKCLGRCDLPFGEFWAESSTGVGRVEPWERMFGKQASSAAHIYGSPLAAAEALTVIDNHWEYGPRKLKRTVDQALCAGLNRLEIHTFTHSPPDVPLPGYEYFAGTHFNPQITWWKQAHAFTGYISRCQHLLQQGRFVADACIYQGDRIPSFVPHKQIDPRLGPGYDYDVVNSEVIVNRMSVRNGWIELPDGMRYCILIMPDEKRIAPPVLEKIRNLVHAGATVIGPKPEKAYGLKLYPGCDAGIQRLADGLWGDVSDSLQTGRRVGKGRVIWSRSARDVLMEDGVPPDLSFTGCSGDSKLDWIHRSVGEGPENTEIYFVANLKERWEEVACTFRVSGRIPERWQADTGEMRCLALWWEENGRITVPMRFPPLGSCFIVFRKRVQTPHIAAVHREKYPVNTVDPYPDIQASAGRDGAVLLRAWKPGMYRFKDNLGNGHSLEISHIPPPISVRGPWTIRFPLDRGAPDSVRFNRLVSWTDADEAGVRFFSGTAAYQTAFEMENHIDETIGCEIDLGEVREVAEVWLNGKRCGILWKPPFRLDVTSAIEPGINSLEVQVTNLWPNRLIGDQVLLDAQKIAFTNIQKFTAQSPLLDSGLLGPVRIRFCKKRILKLQGTVRK